MVSAVVILCTAKKRQLCRNCYYNVLVFRYSVHGPSPPAGRRRRRPTPPIRARVYITPPGTHPPTQRFTCARVRTEKKMYEKNPQNGAQVQCPLECERITRPAENELANAYTTLENGHDSRFNDGCRFRARRWAAAESPGTATSH